MNMPNITELCPGEVNDFLLELVRREYNRIPPDVFCRRKELCQAILACNSEIGNRAHLKEVLTSSLKTWTARSDQVRTIEKLGFSVTKGRTHYKVRANNSQYFIALADGFVGDGFFGPLGPLGRKLPVRVFHAGAGHRHFFIYTAFGDRDADAFRIIHNN